jgi:outer membrane protein OmpA-like peptidoglycan-associated protein
MRIAVASLAVVLVAVPAYGQYEISQPKGTWQQPGEIQQPKGQWRHPNESQEPRGTWQRSGEIQQPRGNWQQPGEIQQPKGPWLQPGEIQVPKGIEAVRTAANGCERRLSVVGDALFDFDKSSLRQDAEETLAAAGPEIAKLGGKAARVEGHTDAVGSDAYNQRLSEARATTVRDWLAKRGLVPATTPIKGLGKTMPIAPNTTADGRDDPQGRQKNRRVDVVFEGCA